MAFMVMAVIFSPIGASVNSSCSVNPNQSSCIGQGQSITVNPACQTNYVNNPNCASSLQFLTGGVSVAFTPSGYSYVAAAQKQSCENVNIAGTTITQVPVLGFLTQLPLLGNIADFFIGMGQSFQGLITGNNSTAVTANNCLAASGSIILVVSYSGTDVILLFIGAILTAAGVAVLSSVVLNAGGALIIFNSMSLGLIYLMLTAFGYATWATIPQPFGSFLYIINTLIFALGLVESVGGIAT